jgi:glycosyltransferase involved in cell wall biosynthesis
MKRKIIHIVLGKSNPARMNGVNKVVYELATQQSRMGLNVAVWGLTKDLHAEAPQTDYPLSLYQDQSNKFKIDERLRDDLKRLDPGQVTVHLHGGFIPQWHAVGRLLRKAGIPYILTAHGAYNTIAMKRSGLKKKLYIQLFEKRLVIGAQKLHLIGKSELDGGLAAGLNFVSALVPNGQKIENWRGVRYLDRGCLKLAFIGRIDIHTKGLDVLLEALHTVKKQGMPVQLKVMGDGPERPKFLSMVEQWGLQENVEWLGAVYGSDKEKQLQDAHFLCLNSRNEGMPGVVLEAAERGVPAIVSTETNVGDYIQQYNAGFVTAKNTPEVLAEKLGEAFKIIGSGRYTDMQASARYMVSQEFHWGVIAEKMNQVYAVA